MVRESELLDPLAEWFHKNYGGGTKLLVYEEPQGKGGRRPDILVVTESVDGPSANDAFLVAIEIERSSHAALHERRNGVQQLRRYQGHEKYLAIPRTVAVRPEAHKIPSACERHGFGLLVVDVAAQSVEREVEPQSFESLSLRAYRTAMRRWTALQTSRDTYRRISHGVIVDSE